MASLKSKIKFNKVRNTGDKLKAKLKKDNKKDKDKIVKDKKPKNKRKIWYWILIVITGLATIASINTWGNSSYESLILFSTISLPTFIPKVAISSPLAL